MAVLSHLFQLLTLLRSVHAKWHALDFQSSLKLTLHSASQFFSFYLYLLFQHFSFSDFQLLPTYALYRVPRL